MIQETKIEFLKMHKDLIEYAEKNKTRVVFEGLKEIRTILQSLSINLTHYIEFNDSMVGAGVKFGEELEDFFSNFFGQFEYAKNDKTEKEGYVYIISYDGMTKIGMSTSPKERIRSLQNSSPVIFKKFYVSDKTKKFKEIESIMHKTYAALRKNGEWFSVDFDEAVNKLRELEVTA